MAFETEIVVQLTPLGTLQSTDVLTVPASSVVYTDNVLNDLQDVNLANVNPRDVLTYIDANTGWSNRPLETLSLPANGTFDSIVANSVIVNANTLIGNNLTVNGTINRNPTITVNLLGDVQGVGTTTLTNLSNGTINISTTVTGGTGGGTNTSYVDAKAAVAYSNAVSFATLAASNAYSNAIAVAATNANTRASAAFTNAVSVAAADATNKAAVAYTNAVNFTTSYAASNTYVNNQLATKANLSGAVFTGPVSGITTLSAGNTTITGFANISGMLVSGNIRTSGSLQVDGDLTVSGNVVTVNVTELAVLDNMIYLNEGGGGNPDLGITGNYNDGIYRHAGIFRDASDGVWKVFDGYVPEPDAFIDTANPSFTIANFQANTVYANQFTGTANNATNLNGQPASYYATDAELTQSYANAVNYANTAAATAYSNAIIYATEVAQSAYANAIATADLDAATKANNAFSNAVAVAASDATTKAATAYSNAVAYAASNTYVNNTFAPKANPVFTGTIQVPAVSSNGSLGLAGQVLTSNGTSTYWSTVAGVGGSDGADVAYANAVIYTNNKAAEAYSNAVLAAFSDASTKANAAYSNAITYSALDASTKAQTAYTNAIAHASSDAQNKADLAYSNAVNYSISNFLSLSGGTVTGGVTFGNISLNTLSANGSIGSNGQILTSNGSVAYWSSINTTQTLDQVLAAGNTTNKALTVGNITINGNVNSVSHLTAYQVNTSFLFTGLIDSGQYGAGGSTGLAGQVLTSNGSSNAYWSTPVAAVNTAASYTWTGTQTFNNRATFASTPFIQGGAGLVFANAQSLDFEGTSPGIVFNDASGIRAGGTRGTNGQVLTSNGSGVYWSTVSGGGFTNGQSISVSNVVVTNTATVNRLSANGSTGSAGQVLTSNGTATYWATPTSTTGTNTSASFAWSNAHTFGGNVAFAANTTFDVNTNFSRTFRITSSQTGEDNIIVAGQTVNIGGSSTDTNFAGDVSFNSSSNVFFSNSNVYLNKIYANNGRGTEGDLLVSGGTSGNAYWTSYFTETYSFANTVFFNSTPFIQSGAGLTFQNAGALQFTGTSPGITFSGNSGITAGSRGTVGQVLTSGGSGAMYWSNASSVNTAATFNWSNTHTFSGLVTMVGPSFSATTNTVHLRVASNFMPMGPFFANGSTGSSGQVLTTNGSNVYWSTPATGGFTNGQSISVSNVVVTNTATLSRVLANGSSGSAGQVLSSNGSSVYWTTPATGGFTNGQSISVSNVVVTNTASITRLLANGSIGAAGQVLTSNGSVVYWTTPALANGSVGTLDDVLAAGNISSRLITVGPLVAPRIARIVTTKTNATGVVEHDTANSTIFYHTSPSNNFIVNFTNVPTDDLSTTVRLVISQGTEAYTPSAVQVNGANTTILWSDGVIPAGYPNQYDLVEFELIKSQSTWLVLGKLSTWKTAEEVVYVIPTGDLETSNISIDLQNNTAPTVDLNI